MLWIDVFVKAPKEEPTPAIPLATPKGLPVATPPAILIPEAIYPKDKLIKDDNLFLSISPWFDALKPNLTPNWIVDW